MATQLTLAPVVVPGLSLLNGEPADTGTVEPESQARSQQSDKEESHLEPGEITASEIKQEEKTRDNATNPFFKYLLTPDVHRDQNASPFALAPIIASTASPFIESDQASNPITPLSTAIQRRNQARVNDIVIRLQNFSGTVTELLAIASVQRQLDQAFAELDHAKAQLMEVFRQFELLGHISNRQSHKKNTATRELSRASQRIVQLTKELWELQRRESYAS